MMISYQSTKGDHKRYKFSEVILKGIADDGGLFVPTEIPHFSIEQLKSLLDKSYQERCLFVFELFKTDFTHKKLHKFIQQAYGNNFDDPKIAPVVKLKDNQYMMELWHGPTGAFKDIALQLMPLFFSQALQSENKKNRQKLKYIILVATSGDTGKAALEGFRNKKGVDILVFYPFRGVSELQQLQMVSQEGSNVGVYAMKGDFDDAQKSVKDTFNDKKFSQRLLEDNNIILSSANSINWGRVLPQIVYHINSYIELVQNKLIHIGDKIDVAVPTGNCGNILAAFYAKKMGLPIRRLICASNANNVLTEFFQTGVYNVQDRTLIRTPSPAMDITIANNVERLLYEIFPDTGKIKEYTLELREKGKFKIDTKTLKILKDNFYADWVSNEDCLETIKKVYKEKNYLMDPHTAVAQAVVDRYQKKYGLAVPIVICSTAHWAKFAKDVYRALTGIYAKEKDEFVIMEKISKIISDNYIPKNIKDLRSKKIRHTANCKVGKEEVEKIITQYLAK